MKINTSENAKQFLSYAEITNDIKSLFKNNSIYDFQIKGKIAFNKLIEGKEVKNLIAIIILKKLLIKL